MFYLICKLLCAWFAFFMPAYSTFKTLSMRPLSDSEIERWLVYWTVAGTFIAVDLSAEWIVSWIPFYWEFRTLFLLYLSLPQTQGSFYIYRTYLQPFFTKHETDIDAYISSAHSRATQVIMSRISDLLQLLKSVLMRQSSSRAADQNNTPRSTPQPSQSQTSGNLAVIGDLWRNWGPSIIASLPRTFSRGERQPEPPQNDTSASGRSSAVLSSASPATLQPPPYDYSPGYPSSSFSFKGEKKDDSTAQPSTSSPGPSFPEPHFF